MTEFLHPERNRIVSSRGYTVVDLGPGVGIRYSEGRRSATIYYEFGGRDIYMYLYVSALSTWDSPCDGDTISDQDKRRIADNVLRAYASCDLKIETA